MELVAYFGTRDGSAPDLPIFIEFGTPAVYGLPTPSLGSYKVAFHHDGPRARDPDDLLPPDPKRLVLIGKAVHRLLPQLNPRPVSAETCMYDNTPTEDFILERHGNVVIGAGTSGHGFKFGPLLGEQLADLAEAGA
jgi:sarcosine oxidase